MGNTFHDNDQPIGIQDNGAKITTIIFDVDDTLYDVGTGFTAHRNTDGATSFMVDKLHFPSKEEAQIVRDEYFEKYHATAKGLVAAEADGRLPPLPDGVSLPPGQTKRFDPADLDDYWSKNLDFTILGGPDPKCVEMFQSISQPHRNLTLVAFSNGPRKYVSRALKEIGLASFFPPENLFAVTDVLPHCKPDKGSFELVLNRIGAKAEECIMVEDSMKNIRTAKALGMRTILVCGRGRKKGGSTDDKDATLDQNAKDAEATKPGDAPDETDPAVDAVVEVASEIGTVLENWLGA
mmetsp:Transcript_3681/g.8117  ORF Transcript_3681/g.8117 Transcript_3681/m.8117 type:complete len:294 (+) Transcript_3681:82-963(+)|eukprot:CAMPEP_0183720880 /NCGR_PEP_ID=MMETSP0737-20130205/13386_1 /TAXON_ID=385413 /ORGANISM="Thalassiosira miniscula, Strain CCMP1093" /LENGTH=293 /DNA_ID=CAMNT_0025950831 /DNA_START=46 /DNA_END=927 /DNA_ORIENTATION=-